MTDELGGTTPEQHTTLPAGGQPVAPDHEQLTLCYGRRCAIAGLALLFGGPACAAVVAAFNPDLTTWPHGVIIVGAATLAFFMTAAGVLLAIAGMEPLTRHTRAKTRLILDIQADMLTQAAAAARAIDRIAEHLPEDQQIRHWRGYNDAVRQGFVESTGTDGSTPAWSSRGRSPHLGLVNRDSQN